MIDRFPAILPAPFTCADVSMCCSSLELTACVQPQVAGVAMGPSPRKLSYRIVSCSGEVRHQITPSCPDAP